MRDYTARVQRGIALLDTKMGPGWENDIDLDRLDISAADDCVLGQLGGFTRLCERFGIDDGDDDAEHGFRVPGLLARLFAVVGLFGYGRLNRTWVAEITRLRNNAYRQAVISARTARPARAGALTRRYARSATTARVVHGRTCTNTSPRSAPVQDASLRAALDRAVPDRGTRERVGV